MGGIGCFGVDSCGCVVVLRGGGWFGLFLFLYALGAASSCNGVVSSRLATSAPALRSAMSFFAGLPLGLVCRTMQIAISEKKLLGYDAEKLVSYIRLHTIL